MRTEAQRRRSNSPRTMDAAAMAIAAEPVAIECDDGRQLAGELYHPRVDARRALVLNGATGVPRGFYERFARYAATRGYLTLVYDYRGIGGSRSRPLDREEATMRDWGRLDQVGALDLLSERAKALPLYALGHSVGAHFYGAMRNVSKLRAAAMVAAGVGYYGGMATPMAALSLSLWWAYLPASMALRGYLAGKAIGWGEDLPREVALDWRRWCLRADYFGYELERDGGWWSPSSVTMPLYSLRFDDDPIATEANVESLLKFYPRAEVTRVVHNEGDDGARSLGHLGFFTRNGADVWRRPLDWFEALDARGST